MNTRILSHRVINRPDFYVGVFLLAYHRLLLCKMPPACSENRYLKTAVERSYDAFPMDSLTLLMMGLSGRFRQRGGHADRSFMRSHRHDVQSNDINRISKYHALAVSSLRRCSSALFNGAKRAG